MRKPGNIICENTGFKVLWLSLQISLSAPVRCRNTHSALRQVQYHQLSQARGNKMLLFAAFIDFSGRKVDSKQSLNRI